MATYHVIRHLLFKLDPERAHHATFTCVRYLPTFALHMLEEALAFEDKRLKQEIWGMTFTNPIGIAPGLDKNAEHLMLWQALGAGFAEIGSATARPSSGNPPPRLFRLPRDRALINRMGLNNEGADSISRRLSKKPSAFRIPLGINIAKTHDPNILGSSAIEDFRYSFRRLAPLADYIALNISCPNTAEGKTFEVPEALEALLRVISTERQTLQLPVPILIKFSPPAPNTPLTAYTPLIKIALEQGIDGFIATNTASDRTDVQTPKEELQQIGPGGLSGPPLRKRATELTRYLYQQTGGQIPIIGVGGIDSPEAAYERIRAGASLLELFTGLIYEGPTLIRTLKQGLIDLLERDGFTHISEAIGADVPQVISAV